MIIPSSTLANRFRSNLVELREALDPNKIDPPITSKFFYSVMTAWVEKFDQSTIEEHDFLNVTPSNIEGPSMTFAQSTPRSSFGQKFLKGCVEFGLNLSNASTVNLFDNNNGDRNYEEKINELTYQNKKLTEELTAVRSQLVVVEDQVENMKGQLKYAQRKIEWYEK